jgi:exodeoxyribonuclease III
MHAELGLDLLHRGARSLAFFLAIERECDRGDLCASRANELDGFADRGARGDHIVDDHDASRERSADDVAALAMILGLLAVECERHATTVMLRERHRRGRRERDAFVGGTEEHVEREARVRERCRIAAPEHRERFTVAEFARVEEVGTLASGLELEGSEAQRVARKRELDEGELIFLHPVPAIIAAMRIITLNVCGIRSAAAKGFFRWARRQGADFICLQETRCRQEDLAEHDVEVRGYESYFCESKRSGYGGVALYTRHAPDKLIRGFGVTEFDDEGRYLEARYGNLSIVSLYAPSGSAGPHRQESKFRFLDSFMRHLRSLRRSRRHYVISGDWNIAHKSIDLRNWRSNQKNSGFLPEERAWMDDLFGPAGYVDAFREVNPRPDQYTWWSNRGRARANNVGWRIDYQVVSPGLAGRARRARIYRRARFSDHAPLVMDYDFPFERR